MEKIFECERCGDEVDGDLHTCPYAIEIGDDYTILCNCCDKCEHECCMDI